MGKSKDPRKISDLDIKRRATTFLKRTHERVQKKIVKFTSLPKVSNKCEKKTDVRNQNHDYRQKAYVESNLHVESYTEEINLNESSDSECEENLNSKDEWNQKHKAVFELNLHDFLRVWSVHHNINRNALNPLLKYLQKFDKTLPKDYRSLLKTPRGAVLKEIDPGHYIHMSLRTSIESYLREQDIIPKEIKIRVNVDGLPIFKDSAQCPAFWIIQADIIGDKRKPFIIGVYGGRTKPKSFNEFLNESIEELKELKNFTYKDIDISLKVVQLLADAPAKSETLNIIGHNGYFSCTKCEVEGKFMHRKMSFLDFKATSRTNNSFRLQKNKEHHTGRSILEELDYFDMIEDVPLDYMHIVLLGVMKKLLKIWFIDVGDFKHAQKDKDEISKRIEKINETVPNDFQRKLRSLTFILRYKASELRSFLLYYGPIVLKNILRSDLYQNFMKLHVAIKICVNQKFYKMNTLTEKLIDEFILEMAEIYGEHEIVHNVHALHHIPKECEARGVLDNFSCFEFENNMSLIKKLIHSSKNPMQQLQNRIAEINSISHLPSFFDNYTTLSSEIIDSNRATINGYKFSTNQRDCYALVDNKSFKITSFYKKNNHMYAKGQYFKKYNDVFKYPINSTFLDIFYADSLDKNISIIDVNNIAAKLFLMNINFKLNNGKIVNNIFFSLNH